jgi:hypothetical protein
MPFVPQALVDEKNRTIIHVFTDERDYATNWANKIQTIDAPGRLIHPRLIKVGDIIDLYVTGWNKTKVRNVTFTPDEISIPDYHVVGSYLFECDSGYISAQVDGRTAIDKIYLFSLDVAPQNT